MVQELSGAVERYLMTSVIVTAILALLIVAAVTVAWWMSRRWLRERGPARWSTASQFSTFNRMDDESRSAAGQGAGSGAEREESGSEPRTTRFIRDAATRAAVLREAWDRSYREARKTGEASPAAAPAADLAVLIEEMLRQQRETNELLREVLSRLERSSD